MAQVAKIDVDVSALVAAQKTMSQQLNKMQASISKMNSAMLSAGQVGSKAYNSVGADMKKAEAASKTFNKSLDTMFNKMKLASMLTPFKAFIAMAGKAAGKVGELLNSMNASVQGTTRLIRSATGNNTSTKNLDSLRQAGEAAFGKQGGGEEAVGMLQSMQAALFDPNTAADFVKATGYTNDAFHNMEGVQALFAALKGAKNEVKKMGGFNSFAGNEVAVKSMEQIFGLNREALKGMFESGQIDSLIAEYGRKLKNNTKDAKLEAGFEKTMTNLSHTFENLGSTLKKFILPVLTPLAKILDKIVKWLTNLLESVLPKCQRFFQWVAELGEKFTMEGAIKAGKKAWASGKEKAAELKNRALSFFGFDSKETEKKLQELQGQIQKVVQPLGQKGREKGEEIMKYLAQLYEKGSNISVEIYEEAKKVKITENGIVQWMSLQ